MIKLLISGDFIPPGNSENIFSEELRKILLDKDFSIVNLETTLTHCQKKIEKTGNNFKRLPSAIRHVKAGYFDAVTLSNNHIRDYGDEGVIETLKTCNQNGILTVGAGRNLEEAAKSLRSTIKGKKISIINYSEREFNIATEKRAGANPFDLIDAFYKVKIEKKENDYVIVIYHGGLEYQYYPTLEMVKDFKFIVDAGADVIVAHHTHRYSGLITYNDKPIFFGLGNFFCPTISKVTDEWLIGIMAEIIIKEDAIVAKPVPVKMSAMCDEVNRTHQEHTQKVLKHISGISSSILNVSFLIDYWIKNDLKDTDRIIHLLKSNSRLEYRFRKYFSSLFKNRLSIYKRSIWLNMIRCDSHRNRLIRILETLQHKK